MRRSIDEEAKRSRIPLDHLGVQPAIAGNIVEVGMQSLFAGGGRQVSQLGLVAVAAGRHQIERRDGERRIVRLGQMVIER